MRKRLGRFIAKVEACCLTFHPFLPSPKRCIIECMRHKRREEPKGVSPRADRDNTSKFLRCACVIECKTGSGHCHQQHVMLLLLPIRWTTQTLAGGTTTTRPCCISSIYLDITTQTFPMVSCSATRGQPRREFCGWLAVGSSVSCFREITNPALARWIPLGHKPTSPTSKGHRLYTSARLRVEMERCDLR
jgi:hypothetical protein